MAGSTDRAARLHRGRGRQPPPDEEPQSRQPSQRDSRHHPSCRGGCSRPRHQWQSRCAAATCRRAPGSRHRCRRNIDDNSCDVGSGDDDSRNDRSGGAASLHQHEQDRLGPSPSGRARSIERASMSDFFGCLLHFNMFSEWFSLKKIAFFHWEMQSRKFFFACGALRNGSLRSPGAT